MQQPMVITARLGTLLGTLGQMLLVSGIAPLIAGHALELAALRDFPCALGLLLHLLSGSVLFPVGVPGPAGACRAGSARTAGDALGRVPLVGPGDPRRPTARC